MMHAYACMPSMSLLVCHGTVVRHAYVCVTNGCVHMSQCVHIMIRQCIEVLISYRCTLQYSTVYMYMLVT